MVSLQDIAKRTGFSKAVVSRALNPAPDQKVAEKSRRIIQEAAIEMGYMPNQAARLMAKGANPSIGIFLPAADAEIVGTLSAGIAATANRHGFSYNIYYGFQDSDYLAFLDHAGQNGSAGILTYLPAEYQREKITELLKNLKKKKCQVVIINSPETFDGLAQTAGIDNVLGGRLAAERFLAGGIRRFCCDDSTTWQMSDRNRGFTERIKEAGEHEIQTFHLPCNRRPLLENPETAAFLRKIVLADEVTGIFAGTDFTAIALFGALGSLGYADRIGKQLRIIGFDDITPASLLVPGLTTLRQPFFELGELSMNLLLNRIADTKIPVGKTILKPELIVRGSG